MNEQFLIFPRTYLRRTGYFFTSACGDNSSGCIYNCVTRVLRSLIVGTTDPTSGPPHATKTPPQESRHRLSCAVPLGTSPTLRHRSPSRFHPRPPPPRTHRPPSPLTGYPSPRIRTCPRALSPSVHSGPLVRPRHSDSYGLVQRPLRRLPFAAAMIRNRPFHTTGRGGISRASTVSLVVCTGSSKPKYSSPRPSAHSLHQTHPRQCHPRLYPASFPPPSPQQPHHRHPGPAPPAPIHNRLEDENPATTPQPPSSASH